MRIALYGLIIISHTAIALYVGHNIGYNKGFVAGKTDAVKECEISLENLMGKCISSIDRVGKDCLRYIR